MAAAAVLLLDAGRDFRADTRPPLGKRRSSHHGQNFCVFPMAGILAPDFSPVWERESANRRTRCGVDTPGVPCYIGPELPVLGNTECGANPQRSRHCDRVFPQNRRRHPTAIALGRRGREGSVVKLIRKPGDESRDQYLRGKRMAGVCACWKAEFTEPMPDSLFPIPFGC